MTTREGTRPTVEQIQAFLVERIAAIARLPQHQVPPAEPLASFGVDSVHALELIDDIESWLGLELPDDLTWRHPTIEAIAKELATLASPGGAS